MKSSVRILRRAAADLLEIRQYIDREAPSAAQAIIDRLLKKIAALSAFPAVGRMPRDDVLRARGYRVLVEGDYLIFYKVLQRHVRVHRVLHGRREYQDLL